MTELDPIYQIITTTLEKGLNLLNKKDFEETVWRLLKRSAKDHDHFVVNNDCFILKEVEFLLETPKSKLEDQGADEVNHGGMRMENSKPKKIPPKKTMKYGARHFLETNRPAEYTIKLIDVTHIGT